MKMVADAEGPRLFGVQGVSQAKAHAFDMIIVDVNMPVMNGIDMIKEVRRLPNYEKTPIFVLTTESGNDTARGVPVQGTIRPLWRCEARGAPRSVPSSPSTDRVLVLDQ